MIHVAEAGENKGRVVLQLGAGQASPIAIRSAIWLARAFQSEIESLFVESEQLMELARHPFAREIAWSGKASRAMSPASIERHFRATSAEFHDQLEILAHAAEVPLRRRVVRGEPLAALAAACRERGPWNVIALAEPFAAPRTVSLRNLFATVVETTGLLLAGPLARSLDGPIVLALEDVDRLHAMLTLAERLEAARGEIGQKRPRAGELRSGDDWRGEDRRGDDRRADATKPAPTIVCLIADDEQALAHMEVAVRFVLAGKSAEGADPTPEVRDRHDVVIAAAWAQRGAPAAIAEVLRRLSPGLVIGHVGQPARTMARRDETSGDEARDDSDMAYPDESVMRALASCLECPLLMMR